MAVGDSPTGLVGQNGWLHGFTLDFGTETPVLNGHRDDCQLAESATLTGRFRLSGYHLKTESAMPALISIFVYSVTPATLPSLLTTVHLVGNQTPSLFLGAS